MSLKPGAFLKNIAWFFFGFLPANTLASMAWNALLGDRQPTSPDWDLGWNPIIWFIVTAPWLVPMVVVVPVLYFLARGVGRRYSRSVARCVLLGATPALLLTGQLILWGPNNFGWDAIIPVAVGGVIFGALQRVPE